MKKSFTVSMIGTFPPIRALSSYCYELVNSLLCFGRIEFISFKCIYPSFLYPGGKPDDDHTYPEITATDLHIKRRLTWYNPFSWIIEGVRAKGEILHAQWWSTPLFFIYLTICLCFKLKKKPILFTVHNVLSHEKSFLYSKMSKILFGLGDHFIVHSYINKNQMSEYYGILPDKISVIPHGSLDFHVKRDADALKIRKEMGLSPENIVILLFGAIRPYKGIDTAIEAFSEINKEFPETRLLIAGRLWEDWTPYKRLIRQHGLEKYVVTHLEYIPSGVVYKYFEISELCLFPYHHFDSQSGAGAVAISFRKPMIVSDVGGLPELVIDRRCIVPAKDYSALADAAKDCLKNPELFNKMKSDAELVAHKFSWSDIAKKTEAIYKKLLN